MSVPTAISSVITPSVTETRSAPSRRALLGATAALAASGVLTPSPVRAAPITLRVGHFPNITHIQGLVAHGLSRKGQGWFERALGPGVKLEWFVYNAGPSAMEAIFADSIDLAYVGPSPAINAYAKARGDDIRIIAGAAEGGAALVVQPGSGLQKPADFRGKKIATPQLGNTQDVSARAWLVAGGLKITLTGGDAQVIPTNNPDQLSLFQSRQLDAVWTVEPWVSRLESEAGGTILVEEKDAITTVLVSSVRFLQAQRELAKRFVAAHDALTGWIKANAAEARQIAREELIAETRTEVKPEGIARSWDRITLTPTVARAALESFVVKAKDAGFLRSAPDLGRLIENP